MKKVWFTNPSEESSYVKETCTIRDLYAELKISSPYVLFTTGNPFLTEIVSNINEKLGASNDYSPIDTYIESRYGSREVLPQYCSYAIDENDDEKDWKKFININLLRSIINSVLSANKYKYEKFIAVMDLDYNPIWNVDSHEESTESRGARDETDVKGAVTTTYNNGSQVHTYDYGVDKLHYYKAPEKVENDYNVGGNRVSTSTQNGSETTIHSNTQMNNTADWFHHDKVERSPNNLQNQTSEGTYKNTTLTKRPDANDKDDISTRDSRQDTMTDGQYSDSEAKGAQTNSHKAKAYEDAITVDRHGNIGTKTTQSMIEEERNVARFDLIREVASDIIKAITFGVYY